MKHSIVSSIAFSAAIIISPARGETASEALKTFGLIGTWSTDCARDPTREPGERVTYKVSAEGGTSYTMIWSASDIPAEQFNWKIVSAVQVTEEKLKLEYIFTDGQKLAPPYQKMSQDNKIHSEIIEKSGNKMKMGEVLWGKCQN